MSSEDKARVAVIAHKTRVGAIAGIRDTEAPSGARGATDAENILLTDHKKTVNEILEQVDAEAADSGEIVGYISLRDGSVEYSPCSGANCSTASGE